MQTPIRLLLLCLAAALLVLPAGTAAAHGKHRHGHGKHWHWPKPKPKPPVNVQLLSFNDFHGALEPPTGSAGRVTETPGGAPVDAGGAAYLATHVRN
jgi:5'-nucleotidase